MPGWIGTRGSMVRWPSLQTWLIALVLLVFIPTLGAVVVSLLHTGRAQREEALEHLQETARVVAYSVAGELESITRLLAGYAAGQALGEGGGSDGLFLGGRLQTFPVALGGPPPSGEGPALAAATAASTGRIAVSNIFTSAGDAAPRLAVAAPGEVRGSEVEVATLIARPDALIRTLRGRGGVGSDLVLAVADGTGRVIARSRDPESFIGRPVPDWARLQAMGGSEGSFEARTLEGPAVIFAFHAIPGTPGWVAVAGEPLQEFTDNWRQPLDTAIVASGLTIAAALLLALLLARRILRPVEALALRARVVAAGRGDDPPAAVSVPRSLVAEFEILRRSLDDAEVALRRSAAAERSVAQALAASERRYRIIAQTGAVAFWARERTGAVTAASGLHVLTGLDDDLLLGDGWQGTIHPDDLGRIDAAWQEAISRDGPIDVEFRIRSAQGHWRWLRSRGAPMPSEEGPPTEWIGVVEDIAARKAIEDDLHLQRERLALAAEASSLGVWDYNIDTDELVCSERWYEIFGVDPARPIGTVENFNRLVHPDDRERVARVRPDAMVHGEKTYHVDFRIVTPAGETRWVSAAACLITGGDGQPNRAVGVIRDVTASRTAEEKLQRSYEALRQAERLARIGSWSLDLATGRFASSDMLHELNGMDPAGPPLMLADLQKLMTPESLARMTVAVERCREHGTPYKVQIEHLRPDGTSFPADVRGQAIRDAEGRIIGLAGTVQDISEREEEKARLAALADNLPSGALYRLEQQSGHGLRLTYISAGVLQLIGVSAEAIVADRAAFLSVIHPEDLHGYEAAVERARATVTVFDHEFRANTRDGRHIWMHCRCAPRTQSDGRVVWDGIMRDITGERQAAEALRQAKESAEAAERMKSDFLAAMSHEIRTPMNTVIGMTRLTLQTELAPKQRNYLEKIDASAKTLLGIINDILDFSKIEAGGLVLEDTVFRLEAVLESVSAVTAMRAEEKGLEIAYTVAPDVPRTLRGDPLRLGQILTNLVSNAVKFTETGEVVVAISQAPARDGRAMLQFAVRDTGIGLDADQIAGLFRPFAQAQADTARKYGGTGLGLAICRQLVGLMGGRIWVESVPGQGSTFFFTIAAVPAAVPEPRPSRRTRLADRRVLIVDDNASARQILLAMVEGFGMAAETVASGVEAIRRLVAAAEQARPFDIVLMDWRMPDMDGLETARRIRSESRLPNMPAVLMVTAYGREEVVRSVEQLGLQGLLIKPITESVMYNTISDILSLPAMERQGRESAAETAERRGLPVRDTLFAALAGKRVLVVDDNALNREVASDFLIAAGVVVETATDGHDALAKLERQDYDAVLMDIHMPRMNGLAAARAIRRQARWAALPIIALTAQARSEDRKASLDAGMTAHLSKPIDEMALYRTLAEVLGTPEGRTDAGPGSILLATPVRLDMPAVLRRFGGKPDRVVRLLTGFLRDFADGPRQIGDHLRAGDTESVAALAHVVKGSAAYLEARDVCERAERLEHAARQGDAEAMAIHGTAFSEELGLLLEAIRLALSGLPSGAAGEAEHASVLGLIAQAAPLVARGDYAAQPLLERISSGLRGLPCQPLAERACVLFDELELEAAEAVLRQLKASLQAEASCGTAAP